jgi:hypothetical protein
MKLYKVRSVVLVNGAYPVIWAGTGAASKAVRREMAEALELRPLKDVAIIEVDVPTGKPALLEWLNASITNDYPKQREVK